MRSFTQIQKVALPLMKGWADGTHEANKVAREHTKMNRIGFSLLSELMREKCG